MHIKRMHTQGKEPLTELFSLEGVSYIMSYNKTSRIIVCSSNYDPYAWFPCIPGLLGRSGIRKYSAPSGPEVEVKRSAMKIIL